MNGFAERLLEERKKQKMTQADVAEALGISFQTVSQWERGETSPDISKLADIAALFHVTTDYLLTGETPQHMHIDYYGKLSDRLFDEKKMYTYVKTYATAHGLLQTAKVLPYARKLHDGQFRKGKDHVPYIYHPLLITCHALALGLDDDNLVSAALLHDVCEDCGVDPKDLPVNDETKEIVKLLTKGDDHSDSATDRYYNRLSQNGKAIMVKLLDRCNNVSGMTTGFTTEKVASYIEETEKWVYPLLRKAKNNYPEYSNQIFLIKYHITSVIESIKHENQ